MRTAAFGVGLVVLLVGECSFIDAQTPKKKKLAPTTKMESRFSPDLIELLTATSGGYELNGKAIAPNVDIAAILRATQSKDAQVQELGRLACELVYLQSQLRKQKPDPEIERVAKANKLDIKAELDEVLKTRVSLEEWGEFKDRAKFVDRLVKNMEKSGVEETQGFKEIEKRLFTDPQKQAIQSSIVQLVGQAKGLITKEKTLALVGEATRPAPASKEPIRMKLETTKDKTVVTAITNQTKVALHHCLVFNKAVSDPQRVDKRTRMEMATRLLIVGAGGAGKDNLESAKNLILLQSVLMNMERGGIVFVPEIPAGATVRVGLTSVKDMSYVKSTEVSLWCDELTVASLSAGTSAGFAPELAGVPLPLDKKGAAFIKTGLTKDDPRDPKLGPTMRTKVCKVYTLAMTAGKTYVIETTADRTTKRLNSPPALRVEDAAGEEKTTFREKSPAGSFRILFTPSADGAYRIVCTEAFGGPCEFTLSAQTR